MHGFLNINKPQGWTSFDVIRALKPRLPRKHKAGHLGTLDPMARGVLPVALGQACKFLNYIEDEDKEYEAQIILGMVSDTQDIWGNIEKTGRDRIASEALEPVLNEFRGLIRQIPPMYSAVHHQGKRLYELARKGMVVERESREVIIKELKLLDISISNQGTTISLRVLCSRGTYIRSLAHDIGQMLGTGAVLSSLLRTRSGPFRIEESVTMEQIKAQALERLILPIDYPLQALPRIVLGQEEQGLWSNGHCIRVETTLPPGPIRVYAFSGAYLGIAELAFPSGTGQIHPRRLYV